MTEFPRIGESMKGVGKEFSSNVPHIILGKEGFSIGGSKKPEEFPKRYTENPPEQPKRPNKPFPNPPTEDFLDKLRKWGLIVIVSVVVGYAGYRIIQSILT